MLKRLLCGAARAMAICGRPALSQARLPACLDCNCLNLGCAVQCPLVAHRSLLPCCRTSADNVWRLYNTQRADLAEQTFELQLRGRCVRQALFIASCARSRPGLGCYCCCRAGALVQRAHSSGVKQGCLSHCVMPLPAGAAWVWAAAAAVGARWRPLFSVLPRAGSASVSSSSQQMESSGRSAPWCPLVRLCCVAVHWVVLHCRLDR